MLTRRSARVAATAAGFRWQSYRGAPPPPPPPSSGALEVDMNEAFVKHHLARATAKGRVTPQAADYFLNVLKQTPEMREVVQTAKQHIGEQDPEQFTAFQQRMYGDVVSKKAAEVAAKTLNRAAKEETDMQDMKEGRPTGENYWLESAGGLGSVDVPPDVKEDIFTAMQKDRKPDSPAFGVNAPNAAHGLNVQPEELEKLATTARRHGNVTE